MKNIFYGLWGKFKVRKNRMIVLAAMYALLFTAAVLLMALSDSLGGQMEFMDKYIKRQVSVSYNGEMGNAMTSYMMETLGSLECVEEYNGTYTGHSAGLKDAKLVTEFQYDELYRQPKKEDITRIRLVVTNRTDNNVYFLYKGFQIVSGRHLLAEDRGKEEALVSEEFAKVNGLKVGDFVETYNPKEDFLDMNLGDSINLRLKIVGIFSHPQVNYQTFQGGVGAYEGNYIFTTDQTLNHTSRTVGDMYGQVMVYLKEGRTVKDIRQQMEEVTDQDTKCYAFHSSSEWAEILEKPLSQMQLMCSVLSVFIFFCILVSILLLGAFHIRQNLHELGIMLGMGVPGWKILFQVFLEEYVPLFLGAAAALLIGVSCMGSVSGAVDRLYTAKTEQITEKKNEELSNYTSTLNDFDAIGRVIQMRSDFGTKYKVDWTVFAAFASVVCMVFPCCMVVQILYKIKHYPVRQVLFG